MDWWCSRTVLRRIFELKKIEVTGYSRRIRNEELNNVYCSPDVIRVNKSERMRWAEHVARIGGMG